MMNEIKFIDYVGITYGSIFLTDNEILEYDFYRAVDRCKSWLRIINPIAVKNIRSFIGTIRDSFYLLPLCEKRCIYFDENKTEVLREEGYLTIGNHSIILNFDYGFYFGEYDNLYGREFNLGGNMTKILIQSSWDDKPYKSPEEYLDSRFAGNDINAAYLYTDDDNNWLHDIPAKYLSKIIVN